MNLKNKKNEGCWFHSVRGDFFEYYNAVIHQKKGRKRIGVEYGKLLEQNRI